MKKVNFLKAMEIITGFHTVELIVNLPLDGNVGTKTSGSPTIHLKSANTGCLQALQNENFQISLSDGLISVSDIFIK